MDEEALSGDIVVYRIPGDRIRTATVIHFINGFVDRKVKVTGTNGGNSVIIDESYILEYIKLKPARPQYMKRKFKIGE